jgi:post-segregation antitoxin (ccd killing protein)
LRQAAEELGISMSELAERAIEHELAMVGSELVEKLRATVELLAAYRRGSFEADAEAFARAEVEEEDPLRARAVRHVDALGVEAAFADPMGR